MNGVIEARCNGAIFCSSELRLKSGEIEEDVCELESDVVLGMGV